MRVLGRITVAGRFRVADFPFQLPDFPRQSATSTFSGAVRIKGACLSHLGGGGADGRHFGNRQQPDPRSDPSRPECPDASGGAGCTDRGLDPGIGLHTPPLVVCETGVIAGHGQVTAARKLGLAHLPQIEVTHLTKVKDADLRRW